MQCRGQGIKFILMKKLLLLALICCSTIICFAQTTKFGIIGGLNESTIREPYINNGAAAFKNESVSLSALTGFNAGVFAEFKYKKISVLPELLYTVKGSNFTEVIPSNGSFAFRGNGKVTINYLELPINVLYNIPVRSYTFFIGGGPYIAYGINGKAKSSNTVTINDATTNTSTEKNVNFGNGSTDYKNPDYGLNASGGVTFKDGIMFNLKYAYGLHNNWRSMYAENFNKSLSLSVGYSFL